MGARYTCTHSESLRALDQKQNIITGVIDITGNIEQWTL